MRIFYRTIQFWQALSASPTLEEIARAKETLTPALFSLFLQMQRSEQAHSLHIYQSLVARGETTPSLLTAALLHDVGKSRFPLQAWERVLNVLGKALFPVLAKRWGQGQSRGWRRSFVIAEQHSAWGAEMAEQAGADSLVVKLIRRHQEPVHLDPLPGNSISIEDSLLSLLQLYDSES